MLSLHPLRHRPRVCMHHVLPFFLFFLVELQPLLHVPLLHLGTPIHRLGLAGIGRGFVGILHLLALILLVVLMVLLGCVLALEGRLRPPRPPMALRLLLDGGLVFQARIGAARGGWADYRQSRRRRRGRERWKERGCSMSAVRGRILQETVLVPGLS